MANDDEWTMEDDLDALADTRVKLDAIEREWKHWREQSRFLTIKLVTVHGFSVAKASKLSGHHRNTIMVWLQVWNAEHKSAGIKN